MLFLISDAHTYLITTSYPVPKLSMGLNSLYCGKWRKNSKLRRDLNLDRTMPNVELIRANWLYYHLLIDKLITF